MTRSVVSSGRLAIIMLGMVLVIGGLVPSQARAGVVDSRDQSASVLKDGEEGTGFAKRPCIDKDAKTGKHHAADSTSDTALKTESGARKHAGDGNHESAARAYEYAACLWDMISEFDNASAAYEKAAAEYDSAAEQHDKAGDADRAKLARENAERIRVLLK